MYVCKKKEKKMHFSCETGNTSLMSHCVVVVATAETQSLRLFFDLFTEIPHFRTPSW